MTVFRTLRSLSLNPLPKIPEGFVYVATEAEALTQIEYLSQYARLAFDTETYVKPEYRDICESALDPHTSRISLLTLQPKEEPPVIFDLLFLERANWDRYPLYQLLFTRERLYAHNGSFDVKFIKRHFGDLLDNVYCTMLMSKLVANALGSKYGKLRGHALADVVRDLYGVHLEGKGSEQISDWYPRPDPEDTTSGAYQYWQQKLTYAAMDVVYLHDIAETYEQVICDPLPYSPLLDEESSHSGRGLGMAALLPMEMQMTRVAAEMEYNGLPVSREMFEDMKRALYDPDTDTGLMVEEAIKLCKYFDLELCPTLWADDDVPTDKSYKALNNPSSLKAMIAKKTGVELSTTQTAVLQRFVDLCELLGANSLEFVNEEEEELYSELRELELTEALEASELGRTVVAYKQYRKLYSFDFTKYINPLTGCIHSRVDMLGAATGRSSSSSPNLQNVPARTVVEVERPLGALYVSSADFSILEPDWSPPTDDPIFNRQCSYRTPYQKEPTSSEG